MLCALFSYRDACGINIIVTIRKDDKEKIYFQIYYREDDSFVYTADDMLNMYAEFFILKYNYKETLSGLCEALGVYINKIKESHTKVSNVNLDDILKRFNVDDEGGMF